MSPDKYRVYPNSGRARVFSNFDRARRFAEVSYDTQIRADITDMRAVVIVHGSGSNYREVARVDLRGFQYTA